MLFRSGRVLTAIVLFFVSSLLVQPASASGEPPVAEAGLGLLAYVGDTVILDGSGSSDPEGDALTYTWTQVGGPPVTISRADSFEPRFEVEAAGTLRFALVVNDGTADSAADEVEVIVPYEKIEGVESGCSTAGAPSALGVLAAVLLARRRR